MLFNKKPFPHIIFALGILFFTLSFYTTFTAASNTPLKSPVELKFQNLKGSKPISINLEKADKATLFIFLTQKCLCSPESLQEIQNIQNLYIKKGISFYGLSVDTNISFEKRKAFISNLKYNFPVLLDSQLKFADYFLVKSAPHAILLGKNGELLYRGAISKEKISEKGSVTEHHLRTALDQFLKGETIKPKTVKYIGCAFRPFQPFSSGDNTNSRN